MQPEHEFAQTAESMTTVGAVGACAIATVLAMLIACRRLRAACNRGGAGSASGSEDDAGTGGVLPAARRMSKAAQRVVRPSMADKEARSSLVGISLPSEAPQGHYDGDERPEPDGA